MTEAEWLSCGNSLQMIAHMHTLAGDWRRKCRLLTVGCWRRYRAFLSEDPDGWEVVATNEIAADAPDTPEVRVFADADQLVTGWGDVEDWAITGAWGVDPFTIPGEWEAQAALIREVVGNPFRPVTFNPLWLTANVLALAQTIYDSRAWDTLPILADALADVGCDDATLLDHLRGPGPHVRGCWALDAVLGRG